jgi:hypothetical protein
MDMDMDGFMLDLNGPTTIGWMKGISKANCPRERKIG